MSPMLAFLAGMVITAIGGVIIVMVLTYMHDDPLFRDEVERWDK